MQDLRHAQSIVLFYIRAFQVPVNVCTWKYRSISSNTPTQLANHQGHDKRGEIWMSLITCGCIHEVINGLVITLEEYKRFLCVCCSII